MSLIRKAKRTSHRQYSTNVIHNCILLILGLIESVDHRDNHLIFVIVVPLCLLGLILFILFCFRHRRRKSNHHHHHPPSSSTSSHHHHHQQQQQQQQQHQAHHHHQSHSHCSDSVKSSIKTRQPFIHPNGGVMPSTTTRTSNDYITTSVDSIPITRQYQQQRYGLPLSSDLASLTSSNLYYARVQAL
jgi:cytoskeletal protein RodZ